MEKHNYKKVPGGIMLTTPCPHNFKGGKRYNNNKNLTPVCIGSHLCRQCPCFVSNDMKAMVVKCKFDDMKRGKQ